jgi:hypothetical protein
MSGLAILTAVVGGAVAFMQATVPLASPGLARADVTEYREVAVIAGLAVLIAAVAIAWLALAGPRRRS